MTIPLFIVLWIMWSVASCLGLCSAAVQPIPYSLVSGQKKKKILLGAGTLSCLLLASILVIGCASRNYPGPVHSLILDGTVQSVDLQTHHLSLTPLKPGQPVTLAYDTTTKFWQNGIPIHPEDVILGKSVRVHYHSVSGQSIAYHLYVQVPYVPQH